MGAQGVCNALVGVRSPVGPPKFCGRAADDSILGRNIMYLLGEKPILICLHSSMDRTGPGSSVNRVHSS